MVWNIIAGLCVLVGIFWTLQGVGIIGGSAMSNNSLWVWIGGALAIAAVAFLVWFNLHPR
jgi:hypothetical protein